MWSRRKFIFFTLAGLASWTDSLGAQAYFDHKHRLPLSKTKPILLAGEYWSPAIACDFIGVLANDLCCIVDQSGRLVIANILPAAVHSHSFPVVGRLDDLGSKVHDLQVMPQSAIAMVWNQTSNQSNSNAGGQFALCVISLSHPKAPNVVADINLPNLSEFQAMTVRQSIVCVAGINNKGENCFWLYKLKRGKLLTLACLTLSDPVDTMVFGINEVLIVYDNPDNKASLIDIKDSSRPKIVRTEKLGAQEIHMDTNGLIFALAKAEGSGSVIKIGSVKEFPKSRSKIHLDELQAVDTIAMNGNNLIVVGSSAGESSAIPFVVDSAMKIVPGKMINLNRHVNDQDMTGKLALGKNSAFIGFGWDGAQVISQTTDNAWSVTASYNVPKLPVASHVTWSTYLVLAGADLKLYDLKQPSEPQKISTGKLPTVLKQIVLAGSYILCLDQYNLGLRKIENLSQSIAQLPIRAKTMCFDSSAKKAYLIQSNGKKDKSQHQITKLSQANIFTDKIEIGKTFSVVGDSYCCSSDNGYVVVGSIEGLAVYKPDQDKELVCQKQFQDLAWRDIVLKEGNIYATAVDPDANGFFYAMSFDNNEIKILGTTKIPHDGLALAVQNKEALTIGQSPEGSSLLTVIDLDDISSPKITANQPVLESACCVSYTGDLAIVSGRGFEIFRLKD